MADLRAQILAQARARLGVPYGLPPGPGELDCSLFVLKVYEAAGLPFGPGIRTAEQLRQACTPIGWADVKPADLLYFEQTYDDPEPPGPDGKLATHIGISLGAGTRRMLSALEPVSRETDISTLYWQQHLLEARRAPQLEGMMPESLPLGVDVSSNNGAINWPAVAGAGVEFAFAKATGGTWYRNPNFGRDWIAMKAAGLLRGAYHFAFETSGQPFPGDGPEAEADAFLAELARAGGIGQGDLLALDIEDGDGPLGEWALRWLQHVEAAVGFKPLVYTGAWFSVPHGFGAVSALGQYGLWLASYQEAFPAAPAPWELVAMHQFSDAGQIPGIPRNVDLNHFNGDISRLPLYGKPAGAPPPPPPAPDPRARTRELLAALQADLTALEQELGV